MQRFTGRSFVITGGANGIGLATARRAADEGATVVLADLDDESGRKHADELGGHFIHTDVTEPAQVRELFARTKELTGSVDVLFNNAGISPTDDGSILVVEPDAWDRVQRVNLKGIYLCCQAAIPYMREQGRGSIINSSSAVALLGLPYHPISYTASKGGIMALSRQLGVQFGRDGIRVNTVCPGPVNTPMVRELFARNNVRVEDRAAKIPLNRLAEPEDVAAAVTFLASDDAAFITATYLPVDGGISNTYLLEE